MPVRTTRRAFLGSGPALAAGLGSLGATSPTPAVTVLRDSSFDPWLEIRADHLRHNVQEIGKRVRRRPILAVVKDNAYGLGVVEVGRILDPQPAVAGLAVIKVDEAIRLRDAGVRKPVLLMGTFDERNLEDLAARDIMPMVYQGVGPELDRVSRKLEKPIAIHVCVDTGIGRVGVPHPGRGRPRERPRRPPISQARRPHDDLR